MEHDKIKALAIELMDAACARKLTEFELDTNEFSIRIQTQTAAPVMQMQAAPAMQAVSAPIAAAAAQAGTADAAMIGTQVQAPFVGIYFGAASPQEPPFVEVGQKVKKGEPLCIIEAMKTMNEIVSPCDGTVGRIFAQNGDMVEYNQLLLVIE